MYEHYFQCPYCWETISVLLDPSVRKQICIEDCEVCCHPIEITTVFDMHDLVAFEAREIGQ